MMFLLCFIQVVNVTESIASMMGTKLEVKMKKAEPGAWKNLDIPRTSNVVSQSSSGASDTTSLESRVDAVDLSDL